jgi:hypothetical protein
VAEFAAALVRKLEKPFHIHLKFFSRPPIRRGTKYREFVGLHERFFGRTLLFGWLRWAAITLEARPSSKPRAAIMALFNSGNGETA